MQSCTPPRRSQSICWTPALLGLGNLPFRSRRICYILIVVGMSLVWLDGMVWGVGLVEFVAVSSCADMVRRAKKLLVVEMQMIEHGASHRYASLWSQGPLTPLDQSNSRTSRLSRRSMLTMTWLAFFMIGVLPSIALLARYRARGFRVL